MLGKWLARRASVHERLDLGALCGNLGGKLVLGRACLQLLENELLLVDELDGSFGALTVERALHQRVLELEEGVAGFEIGGDGLCPCGLGAHLHQLGAERLNIVWR